LEHAGKTQEGLGLVDTVEPNEAVMVIIDQHQIDLRRDGQQPKA